MKHLTKIVVVCAFIAAALYAARRLQECAVVGVPASEASTKSEVATPAEPSAQVATTGLIFPDPASSAALKLGYEVFNSRADGSMMVLPLPPGLAFHTTLALTPGGSKLKVSVGDARCASPVLIKVYRPDQAKPIAEASLSKASGSGEASLDLKGLEGKSPLLLTAELDAKAEANWYCNIELAWAN